VAGPAALPAGFCGGWTVTVADEGGETAAGDGDPFEKAAMALATPAMALTTAAAAAQTLTREGPVWTGGG
jgi:hypothetical protein